MKRNDLKEPIVRQVLLLLFVSFLAMISLLMIHRYTQKRVDFIRSLANNEQVKVELSYLAHENLQTIRSYFQNMSLISTENELQSLTLKINHGIERLEKIFSVIEHGGAVTHTYKVNFADREEIVRKFIYQNYYKNRITVEVIEIRAKLVEMQRYVADFWQILASVMQQDMPSIAQGFQGGESYYEQLVCTFKRLDPFFDRLMENSYRIYFDAESEMRKLEHVAVDVERSFQKRLFWTYMLVGGIIFSLGVIVLRNIGRILLERTAIQAALQASNENLENTVFERTEELQTEVYVRVQSEIEQRRQADFLKTVIDSLGHPFYVLDVNTYAIQIFNKAAYDLGPDNTTFCYGLTHKRTEPCGGVDHPCPIIEIKRTRKPVIMEHIHYDHNNQKIYVEVHGYPIFDAGGELVQIIEYSLDITEKKLAEMALEETNKNLEELVRSRTRSLEEEVLQREKLQLVVEQNPSTIVITDLEGNIEYVNKQFEKVTGYIREEALGQNPKILNSGLTPPDTFVDMWQTLEKGNVWTGEFINKKKNGDIYHENVLLAPLKNDKGEVTNYVAIKENITELKNAREAAESSSQAKSQFLSRMSHELRTPLNAINGFSQLLLKDKKCSLNKRQEEQVLQINIAGQHLLELINEILDLSRIESGRLALSLEPIVTADAVADCIALTSILADEYRVSITVDASLQDLPNIQADRIRFKQVVLNLLSNAIKYNRAQGTVSLSGKLEDDMVCLEVEDSGVGISEEKLKDLFVPFTRLGQGDGEIEGTGIGMTITKHLVELMHGTVEVTSDVGVGSVFCVKFPVVKDDTDQRSCTNIVSAAGVEGLERKSIATLLYIGNKADNIQAMRDTLVQWPEYSLIIRKNAAKGVKAASMLKPDLILMDLNLPDMSGPEAFTELMSKSEMSAVPVIGLCADSLPTNRQEYLDLGLAALLTIPIESDNLRMAIAKFLRS